MIELNFLKLNYQLALDFTMKLVKWQNDKSTQNLLCSYSLIKKIFETDDVH